jgi:hypothetical protein
MMNTAYTRRLWVLTWTSATHSRFGDGARNRRSTRSAWRARCCRGGPTPSGGHGDACQLILFSRRPAAAALSE